ncbi:hypothetical protein GCM10009682_03800 [Luedemannella flava]|uniref:Uncharacterized protein n=1 Tax=Luedemannella flava TaxID=349316 RepID=A0ABP4XJ43_9ACTN
MNQLPRLVYAFGLLPILFPVLTSADEVSLKAEVTSVSMTGQRVAGHYFAGGHVIRTFAGTYVGEFTPEDCLSAAGQILGMFETSNESVRLGPGHSVLVPLTTDRRMLVVGVNDVTGGWFHVCINIASTQTDVYYYDLGNGPFPAGGHVVRRADFWGESYGVQFADNDHGAVAFDFLRPGAGPTR